MISHRAFIIAALLLATSRMSTSLAQSVPYQSEMSVYATIIMNGPRQADMSVDAAIRAQVIEVLIKEVGEHYVFPETAKKAEDAIRERQKHGDYHYFTRAGDLADTLTMDLQRVTADKHLRVIYSEHVLPEPHGEEQPCEQVDANFLAWMESLKFGVERVERLPGNIGYIDLRAFACAHYADRAIAAAMTQIAQTDALIVDLRKNGGGDPRAVTLVSS